MRNGGLQAVLFDWDGTLVDSLGTIAGAMARAFARHGLPGPTRQDMRGVVGLRLDEILRLLHPTGTPEQQAAVVESYRVEFNRAMSDPALEEDLFDGVREGLAALEGAGLLLGVATGKSLRGLRVSLARYDIAHHFTTLQTPDHNPGKPHPGMVHRGLDELGVTPSAALVLGDTAFDMEMAVNAGVRAIGVSWGNHSADELRAAGAEHVIDQFSELLTLLTN